MQLRRNFDKNSKMNVSAELRKAHDHYKNADNKPGDTDERPDRVTLTSNGETVQAILNGNSFIERYEASDGQVTVSQFDVPEWFNPFGTATGVELQQSGDAVNGSTLEYHLGWTTAYHHHSDLAAADAQTSFTTLNEQFSS